MTTIATASDGAYSAGVFAVGRGQNRRYRLMTWKTYRDRQGNQRVAETFQKNELRVVAKLVQESLASL